MGATVLSSGVALARACHPEPTLAVTALATVVAISAGRGAGTAWVTAAVLCGQLSVGWANDYLDREQDRRAGRRDKPVAAGRVDATPVRRAAIVALAMAVVLNVLFF